MKEFVPESRHEHRTATLYDEVPSGRDLLDIFSSQDITFLSRAGMQLWAETSQPIRGTNIRAGAVLGFARTVTSIAHMRGLAPDFVHRVLLLAKNLARAELLLHRLLSC